jgi:hypothetical protein
MNTTITQNEVVVVDAAVAVVVAPEQAVETATLASVGGGTAWGAW